MKKFVILSLLVLGVFLFGCVQNSPQTQSAPIIENQQIQNITSPEQSAPAIVENAPPQSINLIETKKTLTDEDVNGALLTKSDLPSELVLNPVRSGKTTDALQYHQGNTTTAKELTDNGWQSNTANGFDQKTNDVIVRNVDVSISRYEKAVPYLACAVINSKKEDFTNYTIQDIPEFNAFLASTTETVEAFGSEVVVTSYYVRGTYGNTYVNFATSGYGRTANKDEALKYTITIFNRLKNKCPECEQAKCQ